MRKLGETDIANKTIALRVDLNVPIKNENATKPLIIKLIC